MEDQHIWNIPIENFLDIMEEMILTNPEADGIEIDDVKGRSWFIELKGERKFNN